MIPVIIWGWKGGLEESRCFKKDIEFKVSWYLSKVCPSVFSNLVLSTHNALVSSSTFWVVTSFYLFLHIHSLMRFVTIHTGWEFPSLSISQLHSHSYVSPKPWALVVWCFSGSHKITKLLILKGSYCDPEWLLSLSTWKQCIKKLTRGSCNPQHKIYLQSNLQYQTKPKLVPHGNFP